MKHVISFIAGNPILLGAVILVIALMVFALIKKLAKLALFLVTLALVAYVVLHWLGRL